MSQAFRKVQEGGFWALPTPSQRPDQGSYRLILAVSYAHPLAGDLFQPCASHSHPLWVSGVQTLQGSSLPISPTRPSPSPGGANTPPPLSSCSVAKKCRSYIINLGLTSVPSSPQRMDLKAPPPSPARPLPHLPRTEPIRSPFRPFLLLPDPFPSPLLLRCSSSPEVPSSLCLPRSPNSSPSLFTDTLVPLFKPVPILGARQGSTHLTISGLLLDLLGLTCNWAMGRAGHRPALSHCIVTTDS